MSCIIIIVKTEVRETCSTFFGLVPLCTLRWRRKRWQIKVWLVSVFVMRMNVSHIQTHQEFHTNSAIIFLYLRQKPYKKSMKKTDRFMRVCISEGRFRNLCEKEVFSNELLLVYCRM